MNEMSLGGGPLLHIIIIHHLVATMMIEAEEHVGIAIEIMVEEIVTMILMN
jgi:hypothetical protein